MYLPYLRGKQNELLALVELINNNLLSSKIVPIIEPVNLSNSTTNYLNKIIKDNKICLIHNPKVGDLVNETIDEKFIDILNNKNTIIGHIKNRKSKDEINKLTKNIENKSLIIIDTENRIEQYYDYLRDISQKNENKIILKDSFNKEKRNSDYSESEEYFSKTHLEYKKNGYMGFSDYSVIGRTFNKSGWPPYAVVIHIVFFDKDSNLKIRHFISDSNNDNKNTKMKFFEACKKLKKWSIYNNAQTLGVKEIINYYDNNHYPGLGVIKKLSIMNHLELMGRYLDKV